LGGTPIEARICRLVTSCSGRKWLGLAWETLEDVTTDMTELK
jgi:hypothetical protein